MFDNAIKFLSEPILYYKSSSMYMWKRHNGGYRYPCDDYKEIKRIYIILFRIFKFLLPFTCVIILNWVIPQKLNIFVLWIPEYLLFLLLIEGASIGVYQLIWESICSKLRDIVKYFLGE